MSLSKQRNTVVKSFEAAEALNDELFAEGDLSATRLFAFPNQIEDAETVSNIFRENPNCRIVVVKKPTKIGANGFMLMLAKFFTTDPDDNFLIHYKNVFFTTGMSNTDWVEQFKKKAPDCFRDRILHNPKLYEAKIKYANNVLIFIDEVDFGSGEKQKVSQFLRDYAGALDLNNLIERKIRLVVISATILKELRDVPEWGQSEIYRIFAMTIPEGYVGHKIFLETGILDEYFSLETNDEASRWIENDILRRYSHEYRIHLVRVNKKSEKAIKNVCKGIGMIDVVEYNANNTVDLEGLCTEPLEKHIIVLVKNLLRRAYFMPDELKLRIGAIMELFTKKADNNVQAQGLVGRMTGFCLRLLDFDHKTGPYRTSVKAIREYVRAHEEPHSDDLQYQSSRLGINNGRTIRNHCTVLSAENISNLHLIRSQDKDNDLGNLCRVYSDEATAVDVCMLLGGNYNPSRDNVNADGFKTTSLRGLSEVHSLSEVLHHVPQARTGSCSGTSRRCFVCYVDKQDRSTICYVVILPLDISDIKKSECDEKYPPLRL